MRKSNKQQRHRERDYFEPAMLGGLLLVGHLFFNLEEDTVANEDYRRVISTTREGQLVLMALRAKQNIGTEVHKRTSQFVRVERGMCNIHLGEPGEHQTIYLDADGKRDAALIPAGVRHDIKNPNGSLAAKLYVIYMGEPQHLPGLVQHEKPRVEE